MLRVLGVLVGSAWLPLRGSPLRWARLVQHQPARSCFADPFGSCTYRETRLLLDLVRSDLKCYQSFTNHYSLWMLDPLVRHCTCASSMGNLCGVSSHPIHGRFNNPGSACPASASCAPRCPVCLARSSLSRCIHLHPATPGWSRWYMYVHVCMRMYMLFHMVRSVAICP